MAVEAPMLSTSARMRTYPFKTGFTLEFELGTLRDTLARAKEAVTEPHRADFYQIVWVRSGKATLLLDFESIPMAAGSLLFIRKNRVLMYDRSEDYDGLVLRFTDAFFARTADDARYLAGFPLLALRNGVPRVSLKGKDAALAAVVGLMERELGSPDLADHHAALLNLVHNFLILCGREAEAPSEGKPARGAASDIARDFVELVESGYREERRVSAYARRLAITDKRLQSATSQVLGKLPKELIDERVAMEANRLLLFGAFNVKEVSFALGFDEVTNFIKWFRKHAGTTPADFRARYRLG
jgi:AraC-like DNA-binding protein